ncbi:hypothetical protein Ciccas_010801 [Cichlidogyrus casuarinus]|uniref:PHD-type domain-containing protein n=1 Tax=Cichlidogyrus casuarinus TaxID=1844966 RepID=A0ABD2PTW6_9PLAT
MIKRKKTKGSFLTQSLIELHQRNNFDIQILQSYGLENLLAEQKETKNSFKADEVLTELTPLEKSLYAMEAEDSIATAKLHSRIDLSLIKQSITKSPILWKAMPQLKTIERKHIAAIAGCVIAKAKSRNQPKPAPTPAPIELITQSGRHRKLTEKVAEYMFESRKRKGSEDTGSSTPASDITEEEVKRPKRISKPRRTLSPPLSVVSSTAKKERTGPRVKQVYSPPPVNDAVYNTIVQAAQLVGTDAKRATPTDAASAALKQHAEQTSSPPQCPCAGCNAKPCGVCLHCRKQRTCQHLKCLRKRPSSTGPRVKMPSSCNKPRPLGNQNALSESLLARKEDALQPQIKKTERSMLGGDLGMIFGGRNHPAALENVDRLRPVDGEIIDSEMALKGAGFPVVTSKKAAAPGEICFSCGSAGGNFLYCEACSEPFHFYCVDRAFRPRKRDKLLCQNCSSCKLCSNTGVELRCSKCLLAFHRHCLRGYPPANQPEPGATWQCHFCTHCVHCEVTPLDKTALQTRALHPGEENPLQIVPWSSEPEKCADCAAQLEKSAVCPECERTYNSNAQQMLQCDRCQAWIHRTCAKLTPDEYQLIVRIPSDQLAQFRIFCSACHGAASADEASAFPGCDPLRNYAREQLKQRMQSVVNTCKASEATTIPQLDGNDDSGPPIFASWLVSGEMPRNWVTVKALVGPVVARIVDAMNCKRQEQYYVANLRALYRWFARLVERQFPWICTMNILNEVRDRLQPRRNHQPKLDDVIDNIAASCNLDVHELVCPVVAQLCDLKRNQFAYLSNPRNTSVVRYASLNEWRWMDQLQPSISQHLSQCHSEHRCGMYAHGVIDLVNACKRGVNNPCPAPHNLVQTLLEAAEQQEELFIEHWCTREELQVTHNLMTESLPDTPYILTEEQIKKVDIIQDRTPKVEDARVCILCGIGGEENAVEGRLLFIGCDCWVHVNCALWSKEVYEEESGRLVGVPRPECHERTFKLRVVSELDVLRNKRLARLQPTAASTKTVRLGQFQADDLVHERDLNAVNQDVVENMSEIGIGDLLVCRRVFISSDCFLRFLLDLVQWRARSFLEMQAKVRAKLSELTAGTINNLYLGGEWLQIASGGLPHDAWIIKIGALTIHSLGDLREASDEHGCTRSKRGYLCPVGFRASRYFWSMRNLNQRQLYKMRVHQVSTPTKTMCLF